MPNKKGGKNYKKTKHAEDEPILYDLLPGQMYARVLKMVGGCNAVVYCNDGRERLVHIRGNMRKKVWIGTGDIVLISLRELDTSGHTSQSDIERGDICARYDPRIIYKLQQRDKSINPKLFVSNDKTEGANNDGIVFPDKNDMGFEFEENTNEVIDESSDDSSDERLPANRAAQRKAMMDDDVDIDNI